MTKFQKTEDTASIEYNFGMGTFILPKDGISYGWFEDFGFLEITKIDLLEIITMLQDAYQEWPDESESEA